MRLDDIRSLTRANPFQPFGVFLSTGESFEIHHPDMIVATLGSVHISVPAPGTPPEAAERVKIVSLYHIQKIEFLPSPHSQPPGLNGTV